MKLHVNKTTQVGELIRFWTNRSSGVELTEHGEGVKGTK